MITKQDFSWMENERSHTPSKVELESVYSPAKRVWVKDPDLDEKPKHVLAIKCYKVTFVHQDAFVNIIECLDENGLLDHYYNTISNDYIHVKNYSFGKLLTDNVQD